MTNPYARAPFLQRIGTLSTRASKTPPLALRSVSLHFQTHPPWHYVPFPWISRSKHGHIRVQFCGAFAAMRSLRPLSGEQDFETSPILRDCCCSKLPAFCQFIMTEKVSDYVQLFPPCSPESALPFLVFPDPPTLALRFVSLDFQTHPPWHYVPFPWISKPTHQNCLPLFDQYSTTTRPLPITIRPPYGHIKYLNKVDVHADGSMY